jgi:hypothetical protein
VPWVRRAAVIARNAIFALALAVQVFAGGISVAASGAAGGVTCSLADSAARHEAPATPGAPAAHHCLVCALCADHAAAPQSLFWASSAPQRVASRLRLDPPRVVYAVADALRGRQARAPPAA